MAYNFPKDGIYSIKQAQKRLELSDDDLEQCLANSWLCLALPKSVITGATVGHFAALPFDQEENLPAEHQGLIAALRPLPDYLYNVGEHGPTEAVVFNDFSQNSFLLTAVRRYTTSASAADTEVKSPLSGYGELDANAKTKTLADPATLWHLAQAICGEEYGFDPDAVIEGEKVVTGEEIARFVNEYFVLDAAQSKPFKSSVTPEEAFLSRKAEGTDPYLQEWAEHLAQAVIAGGSSAPTKLKIAEGLLADERVVVKSVRAPTLKPSAVAGLIRNTWDVKITK